ncbi:hypothetical protein BST61_g11519 [Cercospora zeina]
MQIHSLFPGAVLVALTWAPLALAAPAGSAAGGKPCIANSDDSNYGPQMVQGVCQAFCQWSSDQFFKSQGVGCTTDSDCSTSMFPVTNCQDSDSIAADAIIKAGVAFCDYSQGTSGPTECFIGTPDHNGPDGKKI